MPMKRRRYLSLKAGHSKDARKRRMHKTVLPDPRKTWKGRRRQRVVLRQLYLLACREQRLIDRINSVQSHNERPSPFGVTPHDLPALRAQLADVRNEGHKALQSHQASRLG